MPETAATGPISKPEQLAREMLAASAALRTWTGSADAAEALGRIHGNALPPPANGALDYTPEELDSYRPFVLCYMPDNGLELHNDNSGAPPNFRHAGDIIVELEQATPPAVALDNFEAHRQWSNTIGDILDDLQTLAATQQHLSVLSVHLERAPFRNHPQQWARTGDSQFAVLRLRFGAR